MHLLGRADKKLRVWFGDKRTIAEPLRSRFLGQNWKGGSKIEFYKIASLETKLHVLSKRTYWGIELMNLRMNHPEASVRSWARTLWKRITFFLQGKPDPLWGKRRVRKVYGENYSLRKPSVRASRFLEMLQTVDGAWAQRFLALPEEKWTYQKADRFFLYLISHLLTDEFYDGELCLNRDEFPETYYQQLKAARKSMKASMGTEHSVPRWLQYLSEIASIAQNFEEDQRHHAVGTLVQTRGAGKPPAIVTLKSKCDLLETLSTPAEPLSKEAIAVIRENLNYRLSKIPDHAFTGIKTKASVIVTSSACYEASRKEGGTLEAINEIVMGANLGLRVNIRDLETGEITSRESLDSLGIGTYIFYACLEQVLEMDIDSLRETKVVVVNEPGKARGVTKGRACLKIVLNVVNKICSEPLRKGVQSSNSGMGKASHGWNWFRDLFSEELSDIIFRPNYREREDINPELFQIEEKYQDAYFSSTDYSNATDHVHHEIADIIGTTWMLKCGIPKLLRTIVRKTCFRSRVILFDGTGPLEEFGSLVENRTRKLESKRGILMGDPLTKVILHFINIGVRDTVLWLGDTTYTARYVQNSYAIRNILLQ
jgi:hypothetical protein